jgi:hypothetical protein
LLLGAGTVPGEDVRRIHLRGMHANTNLTRPRMDLWKIDDLQGLGTPVNHDTYCAHRVGLSSEQGAFARGWCSSIVTKHSINRPGRTVDGDPAIRADARHAHLPDDV